LEIEMTIRSEDLHAEVACPRCGGMIMKVATFCPHCGYVARKSFWEKIRENFGGASGTPKATSPNSSATISALFGLLISVFFFYQAYTKASIQSLIIGILTLVMTLRAWFAGRQPATVDEPNPESHTADDNTPFAQKFFCENCSAQVPVDATACPKCGMEFG
jgi:ribosomal protein L40E